MAEGRSALRFNYWSSGHWHRDVSMQSPWTAAAVIAVTLMSWAADAAPPLAGQWGGDRALLTLDASGGRIEFDCGSGTIDTPLLADADGRFSAIGKHEDYVPGPTTEVGRRALKAAIYRGRVDGDQMTLRVQVEGDKSPRIFTLVRGKRIKIIRCL